MFTQSTILSTHPELGQGTKVSSFDGTFLGTVLSLDEDSFTIERGPYFPENFTGRYSDIAEIDAGHQRIVLSRNEADLRAWRDAAFTGWGEVDRQNRHAERDVGSTLALEAQHDELAMPLTEEQLNAEEIERLAEEMQIRKVVHTEIPTSSVA